MKQQRSTRNDKNAQGAGAVRLEVRVFDGEREGAPAGDVEVVSLGPGEWRQLLNPLAARGVRSGWARVRLLSGESGWLAYGGVNAGASPGERTGDGAPVPMVIVPAAD